MKNLKIKLISLAILICIQLPGAQAPVKTPQKEAKSSMAQLPSDLRNELLRYSQYGSGEVLNLPALANTIIAMGNLISPEKLLTIFESLPTYAAALNLSELLEDARINNPKVKDWLLAAKAKLANGKELYSAVLHKSKQRINQLLSERNINLDWKNPDVDLLNEYPLSIAHAKIAKLLLAAGAKVDMTKGDDLNNTPLLTAASSGLTEKAKLLIDAGANINARNNYGKTPLMLASASGHPDIVKLLLEAGAPVDAKNNRSEVGETALIWATFNGHPDVVKILLDAGADASVKLNNETKKSAIDVARQHGYNDIVELLEEAIAKQKVKRLEKQ